MAKAPVLDLQINAADIARIQKKFAKASGKNLYRTMQLGTLAAGDVVAKHMAQAFPVGPSRYIEGSAYSGGRLNKPGYLRRSVKARLGVKDLHRGLWVLVGPTAPHRHLYIRGTAERYVRPKDMHAGTGRIYFSQGRGRSGPAVVPAGFSAGRAPAHGNVVSQFEGEFKRKASDLVRREWAKAFY